MKTLLLIPSYAKVDVEAAVEADLHPTMDYHALANALKAMPGHEIELIDYAAVDASTHPAVRLVRKVAGLNLALAVLGFLRRRDQDAIFTNAENIALPLAMMFKVTLRRPRHITIAHRVSTPKKRLLYRWLKLHRQMDAIFLYSSAQHDFARRSLRIPEQTLRLIPFHADETFYRPRGRSQVRDNQVCAVGLEWRDYPTLIDAVAEQKDLVVKLAAASPWSKHTNEVEKRTLPDHVEAKRYDYYELRTLYEESSFVVVPLYENDFQAGITTILEGMAMGKAVIVTATAGQTDVIEHEENGLYVAPGDVEGWRKAIQRVRSDHTLRQRLGNNARRWVEENATLGHWVNALTGAIQTSSDDQLGRSSRDPTLRTSSIRQILRPVRGLPSTDTSPGRRLA